MTASKSLPARPSLESLRKQAKKLARDIAAGDAGAIARARVRLPGVDLPLTQRSSQLVLAREYGYAGWQDLIAEVSRRLGKGLEWAATQARHAIHNNDIERLKHLLAEYPALLSWKDDDDGCGLLGMATGAYGDAGDAQREQWFTRRACAELLIDAGAIVMPAVGEGLLRSRARGLLELFQRKGLLPRTLKSVRRLAISMTFAPFSTRVGTISRLSTKHWSARATSSTRPPRQFCWNDRSHSIPCSARTSRTPAPTAGLSSRRSRNRTSRRSERSGCGRCSSWSRSGARSMTGM
jgi:hypothetical protein